MLDFFKSLFTDKETVIYKYRGVGDQKYPSAEVTFLNGNADPFKAFMIVDSGADISIVPKTIGQDLGFKKNKLHYLGGIGGRVGYYINTVEVVIAGKVIKAPFAWLTNDNSPLILGRKGIFDKFRICFDEGKGVVNFS